MAFFNVNAGDAPLLKKLADQFTLSDNYHQAVMGGTYATTSCWAPATCSF